MIIDTIDDTNTRNDEYSADPCPPRQVSHNPAHDDDKSMVNDEELAGEIRGDFT